MVRLPIFQSITPWNIQIEKLTKKRLIFFHSVHIKEKPGDEKGGTLNPGFTRFFQKILCSGT